MGRFWRWFGRKLYTLFLGVAGLAVVAVCYGLWQESLVRLTLVDGIPVTASIQSGKTSYRGLRVTGYCLELTWTDAQGAEQTAECVSISAAYFRKITTGDSSFSWTSQSRTLSADYVAIKYLPFWPHAVVVLEDVDEQQRQALDYIEFGLIFAAIGLAVFGPFYLRERRKRASESRARQ